MQTMAGEEVGANIELLGFSRDNLPTGLSLEGLKWFASPVGATKRFPSSDGEHKVTMLRGEQAEDRVVVVERLETLPYGDEPLRVSPQVDIRALDRDRGTAGWLSIPDDRVGRLVQAALNGNFEEADSIQLGH